MVCKSIVMIVFINGCLSAPVDDPIRIDLPVYDKPEPDSNAQDQNNFQYMVKGYLPENYPGGESLDNSARNFVSQFGNKLEFQENIFGGPFSPPITKLESAVHETEGLPSKALTFKENIQNIVAGLFQPKPIVDTITEEEKYGNTGDKFEAAGKALVGGASGVSNLVNTVLEVPGAILKKITRTATEKLNNLGGKLIGL